MLKFPVGCGRARHVAHQLKQTKKRERRATTELAENTENTSTELSIKMESNSCIPDLPLSMPNLSSEIGDKNTLYSDDECSIVLEDMTQPVEGEADAINDAIERVAKCQPKKSSSLHQE